MAAQILAVVVDCRGVRRQAAFWAAAVSYDLHPRSPRRSRSRKALRVDTGGGGEPDSEAPCMT